MSFTKKPEELTDAEIKDSIRKVGLDPESKKWVGKYSMGMRQRLGIAQAIMEKLDILILDEPSCGLDIPGIMETRAIIKRFMNNGSKIVIISSHDTRDLVELCDEIIMIHKGKIQETLGHVEKDSLKLEKIYLQVIEEK